MEHNKSNYQPPLVSIVEIKVGVLCSSISLTTEDSNYIIGDWEE